MQREIKFRAWHKKEKIMVYEIELGMFDDGFVLADTPDNQLCKTNCHCYVKDFEWMQFTGLKDEQGKEIYEGDIIKTHKTKNDRTQGFEGNIYKIQFKEGYFGCVKKGYVEGLHILTSYKGMVEVIGNIYENSELLKTKEIEK